MEGRLTKRVNPEYPAQARAARVQGIVVLSVGIGTDGKVIDVSVVQGHDLLNDAAIAAVRQWEYDPFFLNGQPVEVATQVTLSFQFN